MHFLQLEWGETNIFFGILESKVHGANMGPTWVLSAPDGLHVGPMNLALRDGIMNRLWNIIGPVGSVYCCRILCNCCCVMLWFKNMWYDVIFVYFRWVLTKLIIPDGWVVSLFLIFFISIESLYNSMQLLVSLYGTVTKLYMHTSLKTLKLPFAWDGVTPSLLTFSIMAHLLSYITVNRQLKLCRVWWNFGFE